MKSQEKTLAIYIFEIQLFQLTLTFQNDKSD